MFSSKLNVPRYSTLCAIFALLGTLWACGLSAQEPTTQPSPTAPISIWNKDGLEDFSFTDCTGKTVTKQDLLGKEWAIGFMYSRCRGPCPILLGKLSQLQAETGVDVVVFTVDPDFDTPERLKSFSQSYIPKPKPNDKGEIPKWYWLTGEKAKLHGFIQRNFLVPAAQSSGEPEHSNCVMHVDETGHVLGKYLGVEDVDMVLLRKIIQKKAPRGKMMSNPIPKDAIVVDGAPPGFTFTRTSDDSEDSEATADAKPAASKPDAAETDAPKDSVPPWVRNLPAVNASLNGLATVLLVIGFLLIKAKRVAAHKAVMLSCFATSIVFLASYCIYHAFVLSKKFPGSGTIKLVYYAILLTHVILAATVPLLASMTIYRALTQQWARHKSIARITFPIWLYVSVTGVIIYLMLYQLPVA